MRTAIDFVGPSQLLGPEGPQGLQPRVDLVVGVIVGALVKTASAHDAQSRTVRAAHRGDRHGEHDGLPDRGLEVQLVVVRQAGDVGLVIGRKWAAGREVERGEVLLLEPDLDREHDVGEAPAALEIERRPQVRVGQDPAVGAQEPDTSLDGGGKQQVFAEIDRDTAERVDAVGVLVGLEGDVVKTLQSIKKGIALLDERRASLGADGATADGDGGGEPWEDEAEAAPSPP